MIFHLHHNAGPTDGLSGQMINPMRRGLVFFLWSVIVCICMRTTSRAPGGCRTCLCTMMLHQASIPLKDGHTPRVKLDTGMLVMPRAPSWRPI